MAIEIRPAVVIEDVCTIVGPRRPDANVCWCLSHRIPSKENRSLIGPARAERVRQLIDLAPPPSVLAYGGDEVRRRGRRPCPRRSWCRQPVSRFLPGSPPE